MNEVISTELPVLFYQDFFEDQVGAMKHALYFGDCVFIAFCGVRGGGKSLSMAYYAAKALIEGKRVLSNMEIAFKLRYPDHRPPEVFRSEPLDWNALYTLQADVRDCVVCIDEIQYFADSRNWASMRNKLLNAIFFQIRKRGLDFMCTVKTPEWLDSRMRKMELDIEVECQDLHSSNENIPKGEYIKLRWYDISGIWTGKPWGAAHKGGKFNYDSTGFGVDPDCELELKGAHRLWGIYNTKQVIDYIDTLGDLQIERTPVEAQQPVSLTNEQLIQAFVQELKVQGRDKVSCDEFWVLAEKAGVKGDRRYLGRFVPVKKFEKYNGNDYYNLNILKGE